MKPEIVAAKLETLMELKRRLAEDYERFDWTQNKQYVPPVDEIINAMIAELPMAQQ